MPVFVVALPFPALLPAALPRFRLLKRAGCAASAA